MIRVLRACPSGAECRRARAHNGYGCRVWHWSRKQPPLAISTDSVLRRERPILLVIHEEDESWQYAYSLI